MVPNVEKPLILIFSDFSLTAMNPSATSKAEEMAKVKKGRDVADKCYLRLESEEKTCHLANIVGDSVN